MEKILTRAQLAAKLADLAFSQPNDAVRLVLAPECDVGGLDLRLVSEMKRTQQGAVELKLIDREKILSLLAELIKSESEQGAERLYRAIDSAAAKLAEEQTGTEQKEHGEHGV